MNKTRIVIIGGTSAIAVQCARIWVQQDPIDLTLIGRDSARLKIIADDLLIRSPDSFVNVFEADFLEPKSIKSVSQKIIENGNVDIVLIAQGALIEQEHCQQDLDSCNHSLLINAVSPILFAEAFANHFEEVGRGHLALIGSVAGDRSRKSNYIYGSSKNMLEFLVKGLQHRFTGTNIKISIIKPGPTDTPMTAKSKTKNMKLARVEVVADDIVKGIEKGKLVVYTPWKWRFIMFVVKKIPGFIFNKMNL